MEWSKKVFQTSPMEEVKDWEWWFILQSKVEQKEASKCVAKRVLQDLSPKGLGKFGFKRRVWILGREKREAAASSWRRNFVKRELDLAGELIRCNPPVLQGANLHRVEASQ